MSYVYGNAPISTVTIFEKEKKHGCTFTGDRVPNTKKPAGQTEPKVAGDPAFVQRARVCSNLTSLLTSPEPSLRTLSVIEIGFLISAITAEGCTENIGEMNMGIAGHGQRLKLKTLDTIMLRACKATGISTGHGTAWKYRSRSM